MEKSRFKSREIPPLSICQSDVDILEMESGKDQISRQNIIINQINSR